MSIELCIRKMLQDNISNAIIANDNISFMQVPEGTSYPNVEYTIISIDDLAIGSTYLRKATVEISTAALTNPDCITAKNAVESALETGTWDSIDILAVVNRNTVFESPSYAA